MKLAPVKLPHVKLAPFIVAGAVAACAPPTGAPAQQAKAPASADSVQTAATEAAAVEPSAPSLVLPIACEVGRTCEVQNYNDDDPGPEAKDYRCGSNTYQAHSGVDIRLLDMAAQAHGVDVLAAAPGRVARLRDGVADVSVKSAGAASVSGQECGNGVVVEHGGGWETQYCHLAKGSIKVKVGDSVAAGQPLAQVGLSGNTEYPHLHLTVRKAGTVVDPFAPAAAPGTCSPEAAGSGLWSAAAAKSLGYKPGTVLNAGFAGASVTMGTIEGGDLAPPRPESPALVAYVRAINLRAGDVQELAITAPDGSTFATGSQPPLDHSKAQWMSFVGKKAEPDRAWPKGTYTAVYRVKRDGVVVIERRFQHDL